MLKLGRQLQVGLRPRLALVQSRHERRLLPQKAPRLYL